MGNVVEFHGKPAKPAPPEVLSRAAFDDEARWRVDMWLCTGNLAIRIVRMGPGVWRWHVWRDDNVEVARAQWSCSTRQEARADAWKALTRLIADAAKGGSRP